MRKSIMRLIARVTFLSLAYQLVYPNLSWALTSGPTQPEVHAFEPVSTTEMVDLFTGDFVYNIPLLDIEGYPINISYHSGSNIDEEASWVGLNWNINPGVVNRFVRGVPDDFKKDRIEKTLSIKPEKNYRAGIGVGVELAGLGVAKAAKAGKKRKVNVSASAGLYVNSSNYRGLSAGARVGLGLDLFGFASAGVNLGIGSQTGADIDYGAGISYATSSKLSKEEAYGVGVTISHGYNTRSGYKNPRISGGAITIRDYESKGDAKMRREDPSNMSAGDVISTNTHFASNMIPIGLQNYVPVITNRSAMSAIDVAINVGGEVFWIFPYGDLNMMVSTLTYEKDGSKDAYGYLYLEEATDADIMDFTRDKDGLFNMTMSYLPAGNLTYDLYSATAQGGGGLFRPYRNDFGSVNDPKFDMPSQQEDRSVNLEAGLGNLFEIGGDYTGFFTHVEAGPWADVTKEFKGRQRGSLFENVYFKQAGELTAVDQDYLDAVKGTEPLELNPSNISSFQDIKPNSNSKRDPRGNLVYFHNAWEASDPEISTSANIVNYTDANGLKNGTATAKTPITRYIGTNRQPHQISEIVQLQEDGTRYVYGLPAMNNVQSEYAFSVEKGVGSTTVNEAEGLVTFDNGDNSASNNKGVENYFSSTITPSYAHSFLLTSVLGHDYVDVSGDGITDDDLGDYTKFNYSRKEADYRWRTPYTAGTAHYNAGFKSDKKDDKGYYTVGSKELWYLHSVESKNFLAEFYTSPKNDGKGSTEAALSSSSTYGDAQHGQYRDYTNSASAATTYKLDSIVLYNKHDRFINKDGAVPIKSVIFDYTYELCPDVPNNSDPGSALGSGKLTLKRLFIRYGRSDKNLISPYQFNYSANNYSYNNAAKNRWGGYKDPSGSLTDFEYPYVDQDDPDNNKYAGAWHLTEIKLPSGGVINVDYESDDYAYVQDKRSMEMFKVAGVGTSTNFQPNTSELYSSPNTPFSYIYFKRRKSEELTNISDFKRLYLEGSNILYYNFSVDVTGKGLYEQVRGYAEVLDVGETSHEDYGYVKVAPRHPKGTSAKLHPVSYTGINLARYNLPHVLHPGQDPGASSIKNILQGLAAAASELFNVFKNPMEVYIKRGLAKRYDISKSYVRLSSPGMNKKGGGSRVKSLKLDDSWSSMAAGQPGASYGKTYNYVMNEPGYGMVSSGVASYEPMAGGDENPFKMPVKYNATNGTNFPPNDPVELYQEEPIGESLFPSPVVGYRQVEVESIHADYARSSQMVDRYEFYTAKDFPLQVKATPINFLKNSKEIKLLKSKVELEATQGYSIVMNDMHGKPKANYSYVVKSRSNGARSLVSSNVYEYRTNGAHELSNTVNGLVYNKSTKDMEVKQCVVGQEIDITIDSRQKKERTTSSSLSLNLNLSLIGIIPIPIPLPFTTPSSHDRVFSSAVTTKVVQQYGIVKAVQSFREGATTRMSYEVYDPNTGIALLTKTSNEFDDAQYNMTIPAYWTLYTMGGAYNNIGFEDNGTLNINNEAMFLNDDGFIVVADPQKYNEGDELMLSFYHDNALRNIKVWVTAFDGNQNCELIVEPRTDGYSSNWPMPPSGLHIPYLTIPDVNIKVIRSGRRNQLKDIAQTYTALSNPIQSGKLDLTPDSLVDIKTQTFLPNDFVFGVSGKISTAYKIESLNAFITGKLGIYRPLNTFSYIHDRNYVAHSRKNGLFDLIHPFWSPNLSERSCTEGIFYLYNTASPGIDFHPYWRKTKAVERYSAWGGELENVDAAGTPSSALYGYDHSLPVATVHNSKFSEIVFENFEDFKMLLVPSVILTSVSHFKDSTKFPFVSNTPGLSPVYKHFSLSGSNNSQIVSTESHSGLHSLFTGSVEYVQKIDGQNPAYVDAVNKTRLQPENAYHVSCWVKGASTAPSINLWKYASEQYPSVSMVKKGSPIEGWQQFEAVIEKHPHWHSIDFVFPANCYVDDVRLCPLSASMKTFVYHPYNQRLMATLDENNYATLYEYDQEGILIRVKKETDRGILTIQESRQSTIKAQ